MSGSDLRSVADGDDAPPGAPGRPEGHVILVGLPGAGKSTVGRRVARRLGRPFLDFDVELERREGQSVAAIFAAEGEAGFRAREAALSAELARAGAMVLAPGGGWLGNTEASSCLRPAGRLVYLRVTPAVALARLGKRRATRPLLAGADPLGALEALLARRTAAYETADLRVDVDALSLDAAAAAVVAALARATPHPR